MNKVIMMGRLTRDPEIRYSQNGSQMVIARFSLAVDRRFKKQGNEVTADFFNCTAFGKTAEFVERYLKQGTKIVIAGNLQNNNYTNKDGQKVYGVQILIEEINFAESKASASAAGQSDRTEPPKVDEQGFMSVDDNMASELPF